MKRMQQVFLKYVLMSSLFLLVSGVFLLAPMGAGFSIQAQAQFFSNFTNFEKKSRVKKRYRQRQSRSRKRQGRRRKSPPLYVSGPRAKKKFRTRRARRRYQRKQRRARLALRRLKAAQRRAQQGRESRKRRANIQLSRFGDPAGLRRKKRSRKASKKVVRKRTGRRKNVASLKQKNRPARNKKTGRLNRTPLQVVISIPGQSLKVFQGTKVIASSRISSGKAGHRTPTGVFSIIQKNRVHHSNIYNNAPMPNMQRITWSGIAMHAGRVPGYPASHGCIRLPYSFSKKLFRTTRMGAHVIVQNGRSTPRNISHSLLFQPIPEALFAEVKLDNKQDNWSSLAKTVTLVSSDHTESRVALNSELFQLSSAKIEKDKRVAKTHALFSAVKQGRSESPLRIFITRRTERERVREIQKMLNEFGYELGEPNGYFGKKTKNALYTLQDEENMDTVNGRITPETEQYLRDITGYHLKGNGHLYIRQDFKQLFDTPIHIEDSKKALGTHIFTAQNFSKDDDLVKWVSLTVKDKGKRKTKRIRVRKKGRRGRRSRGYRYITKVIPGKRLGTAKEALDRIVIKPEIRTYISRILTPGTSLTVSHHGYSNETGKGTDFVVKVR